MENHNDDNDFHNVEVVFMVLPLKNIRVIIDPLFSDSDGCVVGSSRMAVELTHGNVLTAMDNDEREDHQHHDEDDDSDIGS
jgi:hypothetical protein